MSRHATLSVTVNNVSDVLAQQFDFTVDKRPLKWGTFDTPHFGVFQLQDSDTFGVPAHCLPTTVKAGYVPHTLDDIAALCEAALTGFGTEFDAQISCWWSDKGHEVIIAPSKDYRKSIFGTNDNIFPRIKIGGYFGRKFQGETGWYRDACKNLAIVRQVSGASFEISHTQQLRSRMSQLVEQFGQTRQAWETMTTIAANLESTRASVKDFITSLYPAPTSEGKGKTQLENKIDKVISRLLKERIQTGRDDTWGSEGSNPTATLWELVNAVTGFVQHDKTRHVSASGNAMGTIERALVGVNDEESVKAWDLALAMAS